MRRNQADAGADVKKSLVLVLAGLVLVILCLAGTKALQIGALVQHGKTMVPPPVTVTSAEAKPDAWTSDLTSVGTLSAVQGVTVAPELDGKVAQLAFESGAAVRKGDLLLRQDTSSEQAQLPGAQAALDLARINRERADRMLADKILSQADHDTAVANFEQAKAQVDNIRATIEKKNVKAPFNGRVGVRQVNLGQLLHAGDAIVTLQSLDPIFADFSLPQQELAHVRAGLPVRVTCDALPGKTVEGKVTAISPLVDTDTRNIKIQATLHNQGETLRPGMFVNIALGQPERRQVLVLPATSVLYAPYSDSVFVLDPAPDGKGLVLRQQLVRLGAHKGDLVAVEQGLKPGEKVVSTGVFKLRNGMPAVVDNKLAPDFQTSPNPENK
jgi:membrane fusion protein (multidrug efflux system)